MPQLIIEQPGVPPQTIPLSQGETRFGRSEDSDVMLVADEVSRHHAKIVHGNGKTVLVDLKSLNGTYVNRHRIKERVLTHLDEIWFGSKCRLIYRDDTNFGRMQGEPEEMTSSDTMLVRNMDKIRAEMDRVSSSMTMIGQRKSDIMPGVKTPPPQATPEDVVKMGQAFRRLASLYKASQVMASHFDLTRRLSDLLDIAIEVTGAERGFIMLREEGTRNLNVKVARRMGGELEASSPSMGIAGRAAIDGDPVLMRNRDEENEFSGRESIIRSRIASAMCVPLTIENRTLGSIYVDTRNLETDFGDEDLELFASLASQSAMAIDHVHLHERMVEAEKRRQNLGRFLSPAIVDKILSEGAELELGGRKQRVSTLFCDIRGSTALAERLGPQQLVALLNEHFTAMTEIIFENGGTLDKYIGDEIMAVFGSPIASENDAFQAVTAALAIQERNQHLNMIREREGRPALELGIGIETGEVIAGYIGSPMRLEFTVVGDRVNTAKRFCDMAEPGKVVAGQETWQLVEGRVTGVTIGTVMLKGKERPVLAYEVTGLREEAG